MILGAAGFIGTNLTKKLASNKGDKITLVDKSINYFVNILKYKFSNVEIMESSLDENEDFSILEGQDIVYHLVSTNVPTTSNQHISQDIKANVLFSSNLFEACVKHGVKKVVFISSGGTVYGKEATCPLSENTPTNPISSYGVQKITIEKLLYLYSYMYGLDYRIIRLAKGDVFFEINPHDEEYFYLHEMENTSVDFSAYKFLIKLKKSLLNNKSKD